MIYYHQPEHIGILASTIDKESIRGDLAKLNYHIFLEEKVNWYNLPDDEVRRFGKYRPGFQEQLDLFIKSKL